MKFKIQTPRSCRESIATNGDSAGPNSELSKPATALQPNQQLCACVGPARWWAAPNTVLSSTKKMLHNHAAQRNPWHALLVPLNLKFAVCCFGHPPAGPHGPAGGGGHAPVALAGGCTAGLICSWQLCKQLWEQLCKRPTKQWDGPWGQLGLHPTLQALRALFGASLLFAAPHGPIGAPLPPGPSSWAMSRWAKGWKQQGPCACMPGWGGGRGHT